MSRLPRLRLWFLGIVNALILLHIILYYAFGRTSVGCIDFFGFSTIAGLGLITSGSVFLGILVLSTLVFGRIFCGWGCHFAFFQDVLTRWRRFDAECNFWGKSTPPASKFYGPVDYAPYLSSDPLPGPVAPLLVPDPKLPRVYSLAGNAPNPFNPVTTIRYEVPPPGGHVGMRVYNVRGQLVRVLINEHVVPGFHTVPWNGVDDRGREVASGVYFLQMTAPNFKAARKIVMLK